jgi:putative transposase
LGEVWQRGFSEVQVMDQAGMEKFREYIANNPVKARLVESADEYPFSFRYLAMRKFGVVGKAGDVQGLKPV